MDEEDVNIRAEDERAEVPEMYVHPRPLNAQTQLIVALIGIVIFGTGVVCGMQWIQVTSALNDTAQVSDIQPQRTTNNRHATVTPVVVQQVPPVPTSTQESALQPPLVTGSFTGYYTTYDIEVWGESATCNAFVVTNGQEDLVQKYTAMVREGNSVQRLDTAGHLILNLPWKTVPEADRNIIHASKTSALVTLTLTEARSNNAEADLCHSFFTYGGVTVTHQ